ncbi:MAG: hypothetical protein EAX96_19845 [Candidatus Lokiarchaeota archaeon]|nr:hypothetical protein [Candidatus Lokiarchaeota archaeon]
MKEFNGENNEFLIYYILVLLILKDIAKSDTIKKNIDDFLEKLKNFDGEILNKDGIINNLKEIIEDSILSLKKLDEPPPMFLNMYDFLNDFLNFSRGKRLEKAFKELGLKPERLKDLFEELSLDITDERVKLFFDLFELTDRYQELLTWLIV